jgi:mannose-6-phosphate isomerase-like protein (cupin superfamily)
MSDEVQPKYIVRQVDNLDEARSTCGFRRAIFTEEQGAGFSMSVLRISDSSRHYHLRTWEAYYVLDGEGELELDDETVVLKPGTAVLIRPGVRHTAKGAVTALILGTPPFTNEDMLFD